MGVAGSSDREAPGGGGQRGLPRLSGLDGIRGLAALAVVVYHAGASWLPAGFLGVDVFFVVSGFLITSLLIAEREREDRIDLVEFWLRRARRLLPALALVLIATTCYAAVMLPDGLAQHLREALAAAVYVTNWDQILRGVSYFEMFERPSQLRHLWSLAVEEQFYIVWPVAFGLGARVLRLRWLWCVVVGVAALSVVWMAILFTPGDEPSRVYFGSDARAFTILIGVAAAFVWRPWRWTGAAAGVGRGAALGYLLDALAVAALIGIGAIMAVGRHWSEWMYPWGLLATSGAAMALVACVIRPGSLIGRGLEMAPLRWLGERSYSIYLWHWPALLALQWEFGLVPNSVAIVAVGSAVTLALSELSYRLVESPMRRADFWDLERMRGRLAGAQTLIAVCASAAAAVLLALVIGFAILPGRAPSDLLFSASAEQSEAIERPGRVGAGWGSASRALRPPLVGGGIGDGAGDRGGEPAFMSGSASGGDAGAALAAAEAGVDDGGARQSSADGRGASEAGSRAGPEAGEPADDDPDRGRAEPWSALSDAAAGGGPGEDHAAVYTVQAGDSLAGLSERFGTTIEELVAINGERMAAMIHPGDGLRIPCPGASRCAMLELEQIGAGCVALQELSETRGWSSRVCASGALLVELPVRLSAIAAGPLDSSPEWRWRGSAREAMEWTLSPDQVGASGEAVAVAVRHGLPPLAIGDSVMAGAAEQLSAVGIEVDAEVGRLAPQALAILAEDAARHGPREVVIFQAVGPGFLDAEGFRHLIEIARGVGHLIVLTRQFPPREPLLSYERDTNKMLREAAPLHDWVTLVDWNAISDGREEELTWDGTHLNEQGRELYADQILAAIMSRPPAQFRGVGE